jgi:hypothetical protein
VGLPVAFFEVLPSYTKDLAICNEATEHISKVRAKNVEDRGVYYKECSPHYKSLKDVCNRLNVAAPLIGKKIAEKEDESQKDTRRFIIKISLTAFAILISLIIGVVSFLR